MVTPTKLKAPSRVVVYGNEAVVALAVSETVVLWALYVGDVVGTGGIFPTLVPAKETFCPSEPLVSSRDTVIGDKWSVSCSVVWVRIREDPVVPRSVLSFSGYVPVWLLNGLLELPAVGGSVPVVPSDAAIETLPSKGSLGCSNDGVEERGGNKDEDGGSVGSAVGDCLREKVGKSV